MSRYLLVAIAVIVAAPFSSVVAGVCMLTGQLDDKNGSEVWLWIRDELGADVYVTPAVGDDPDEYGGFCVGGAKYESDKYRGKCVSGEFDATVRKIGNDPVSATGNWTKTGGVRLSFTVKLWRCGDRVAVYTAGPKVNGQNDRLVLSVIWKGKDCEVIGSLRSDAKATSFTKSFNGKADEWTPEDAGKRAFDKFLSKEERDRLKEPSKLMVK